MRSLRKPALLLALVALVALAVPAVAGASKVEEKEGVLLAPVGTQLTVTSDDAYFTGYGTFDCDGPWTMHEELTKNDGSTFEAISTADGEARCEMPYQFGYQKLIGLRWGNLTSSTSGKGTTSMSFKVKVPGGGECSYSSPAVPFTYKLGSSAIEFVGAEIKQSPLACPPRKLNGTFTFKIGTTPVIFN